MKKYILNWRVWVVAITACVALCLLFAEPIHTGSNFDFLCRLIISKAGGVLLFVAVMAEVDLWKKYFPFLNKE